MKLKDALKTAVENEDWHIICDVYFQITGIPIEPPQLTLRDAGDLEGDDLSLLDDMDIPSASAPRKKAQAAPKKKAVKKK